MGIGRGNPEFVTAKCYERLMHTCRDCRAGLDHCHGTAIRHSLRQTECTEDECTGPEHAPHALIIDCDAISCTCAGPAALAI